MRSPTDSPENDRFQDAARAFADLCRVMAKLRAPGGCPWDREQTLESLKVYLLEEAYETLEALDSGAADKHREELGDLLLQIVFQAEITAEAGGFGVAEVARGITEKLVRRHPHVFGDAKADSAAGALANWEAQKAKERPKEASVLAGVPAALPALLRALRVGEKAAAVGFDWNKPEEARAKVEEEWQELAHAVDESQGPERVQEELGDLLFAIVNVSRRLGQDPETALRRATDKFSSRFRYIEDQLRAQGRSPREATLDELNQLWEDAKLLTRPDKAAAT